MKKVFAFLLCSAVMMSAGCSGGGGGSDSPSTSTSVDTEGTTSSAATTTTESDTTTAETTTPAPVTVAEAKDFDFVVMQFNCREFVTKPGGSVLVGDNYTATKKGEWILSPNIGRDATIQAFQQPLPDDPYFANRFMINQNGDFWQSVDRIEASFYVEDATGAAAIEDVTYMQAYIQMGGLSKEKAWRFYPEEANGESAPNLIQQFPEGEYALDSAHVMTVTWDIKSAMESCGTLDAGDPDAEDGKGGGVHKFGVQIGDEGIDEKTLKICWTDVTIYVKDKAKFDEYVAKVSEVNGAAMPSDAKIVEVG